jgi:hypothetical protein
MTLETMPRQSQPRLISQRRSFRGLDEPLGYPDGLNAYTVEINSPVGGVDPTGTLARSGGPTQSTSITSFPLSIPVATKFDKPATQMLYLTADVIVGKSTSPVTHRESMFVQIRLHRTMTQAENNALADAAASGSGRGYSGASNLNPQGWRYANFLMQVDWQASGNQGNEHNTVNVQVTPGGGAGWLPGRARGPDGVHWIRTHWSPTNPSITVPADKSTRKWADTLIHDVEMGPVEIPVKCGESGTATVLLFHQYTAYFEGNLWGRFRIDWDYTGGSLRVGPAQRGMDEPEPVPLELLQKGTDTYDP